MKVLQSIAKFASAAAFLVQGTVVTSAQNAPSLDDIHWHLTDAYCSFQRTDQQFNYHDPESWRYIFLTGFSNGTDGELAYVRVDGRLRELQEKERFKEGNDEIVVYKTWDKNPYTVTVQFVKGKQSAEWTEYTGVVHVERNGVGAPTPYKGGCGV